jgi:hypothetical protein
LSRLPDRQILDLEGDVITNAILAGPITLTGPVTVMDVEER